MNNHTIGFIGYGNMAQAIAARHWWTAGVLDGERHRRLRRPLRQTRTQTTPKVRYHEPLHTAAEVADAADVVVIAIKPYQIEERNQPHRRRDLAQRKQIRRLHCSRLGSQQIPLPVRRTSSTPMHIQCTIPNTPMAVSKGVLVTESDNTLSETQTETFEQLFAPISLIERVDSAHMGIAMCVAGCAPAFTDRHRSARRSAGRRNTRLQRATAYRLACEAWWKVWRALYLATETHPGAMKDAVCSPRRHHHQRCRLAGGERVPWRDHQGRRRRSNSDGRPLLHPVQQRNPVPFIRQIGHETPFCRSDRGITIKEPTRDRAVPDTRHSIGLPAQHGSGSVRTGSIGRWLYGWEPCLLLSESSDCRTSASPPCSMH